MYRWLNWIKGIQQELKAFLFFSILFTLFRIVFLIIFQSQLDTTTMDSILMSLWLGFRLSLKTVGSIVLVSLLFATLPSIVWPKWKAQGVRKVWYGLVTIFFTLLFMGRIPFYTIFNSVIMRSTKQIHQNSIPDISMSDLSTIMKIRVVQ